MPNSKQNFGGTSNASQIMCKSEYRPIVADGTEIGIFGIRKNTVLDKLRANSNVGASLERCTGNLKQKKVNN